jgi:hypothetical protein
MQEREKIAENGTKQYMPFPFTYLKLVLVI